VVTEVAIVPMSILLSPERTGVAVAREATVQIRIIAV